MLESLTIRNFAIIDELDVEFSRGLNVITGETGAGKSIVVDALELALGARSSSEMVRAGADGCSVAGVFSVDSVGGPGELPVEPEDGCVILRREVRADGSGRSFANDRPVTLRVLKESGDRLVDLHGQHDHQSLLAVQEHIRYLDGFAGLLPLTEETSALFREYSGILEVIDSLRARIDSGVRDRELHRFQMAEIESAAPVPGEDADLHQRILTLSRASNLKSLGFSAFQELSENDGSVADILGDLAARVRELARYDDRLSELGSEIDGLESAVGDLAREFRSYGEHIDDDPASLAELETRLGLLEKLKKKYGPSLDDVIARHARISAETEDTGRLEEELTDAKARLHDVRNRLIGRARELSSKRAEAGPRLALEVQSHLAELGMPGARLVADIAPFDGGCEVESDGRMIRIGKQGIDRVEFLISSNPGEPPRPLVKIASGGEVSRIMLAIKLALAGTDSVPTLVFDEVDTGVSGRIAEAVGIKLKKLSETRQTLVVTHLPQIAALADRHFSARKTVDENRTRTGLVVLDRAGREEELATLLSGGTVSETARAHARAMLDAGM